MDVVFAVFLTSHYPPCVFSPEQTQLADMEHSHSLCESLVQQRDEVQREAEKMRSSLRDVERTLGTRERAHRHRVKGLEEQVGKGVFIVFHRK